MSSWKIDDLSPLPATKSPWFNLLTHPPSGTEPPIGPTAAEDVLTALALPIRASIGFVTFSRKPRSPQKVVVKSKGIRAQNGRNIQVKDL